MKIPDSCTNFFPNYKDEDSCTNFFPNYKKLRLAVLIKVFEIDAT